MTPARQTFTRAISAALLVATVGCSQAALIAERDGGSGPDARVARPRADECGNGIDDDGNGRIDDSCPCGTGETQECFTGAVASRHVGACADGVQTCRLTGVEWGDWGDSPCVGGTAPAAEQCDGMDHDCDGARDEDCPCTAGMTQTCGLEFLTAPCHGGTQSCRADGTWSACDGAVGPTPDVCDGTDNDCDGTSDEGCGCMPEPERCRDGIDNDCDGEIDEPACTPDWPLDSGAPDAGVARDGGAPICGTSCVAMPTGPTTLTPFATPGLAGYGDPLHLAANDTTTWILANRGQPSVAATRLTVIRATSDGTAVGESEVSTVAATLGSDIAAVGSGAAVVFATQTGTSSAAAQLAFVDAAGVVSTPVDLDPGQQDLSPFVSVGDGELGIVWMRYMGAGADWEAGAETRFQRRSLDGSAIAPSVAIGTEALATSIAAFGGGYLVGTRHRAPDFSRTSQVSYVVGDAVMWTRDLPMREARWDSGAVVAASCDRALVCWRSMIDMPAIDSRHIDRCTILDTTGAEIAAPFEVNGGVHYGNNWESAYINIVWADGQFVVYDERTYNAPVLGGSWASDRNYVAVAPTGAIVWQQGFRSPGYPYGDVAWGGGCVVSIEQGDSTGASSTPVLRRMCATACP